VPSEGRSAGRRWGRVYVAVLLTNAAVIAALWLFSTWLTP